MPYSNAICDMVLSAFAALNATFSCVFSLPSNMYTHPLPMNFTICPNPGEYLNLNKSLKGRFNYA